MFILKYAELYGLGFHDINGKDQGEEWIIVFGSHELF